MTKSDKLRVGILGCGQVGKIHARHYHELGEKVTRIYVIQKKMQCQLLNF